MPETITITKAQTHSEVHLVANDEWVMISPHQHKLCSILFASIGFSRHFPRLQFNHQLTYEFCGRFRS